jgi:hypothetical protein
MTIHFFGDSCDIIGANVIVHRADINSLYYDGEKFVLVEHLPHGNQQETHIEQDDIIVAGYARVTRFLKCLSDDNQLVLTSAKTLKRLLKKQSESEIETQINSIMRR